MKNIFLYIVLLSLFFFGCKSTDNVVNPENANTQDSIQVDDVLPVELESDLQEEDSLLEEVDENLSEEELEKIIAEQGDLPLPLYEDFVPITEISDEFSDSTEFENSDEFFYGDEFVPEDTTKLSDLNEEVESTEQLEYSDEVSFNQENLDDNQILFDEKNSISQNSEQTDLLEKEEIFYPENFTDSTENSEIDDFAFTNELNDNEKSVIVDDILNKKDYVNSETVATNKTSDKETIQSESSPKNFDTEKKSTQEKINEKTSSVEKTLFEDFSKPTPEVILEDLEKDIVPSRTVYASKNQLIIASYPGNGWVYLGEIDSSALVSFKGKSFSSNKTSFKLQPQKDGRTILHFYKLDAINGNYIDDYLEVIVTPTVDYSVANTVNAPDFNYDYYLMNDFNKNIADNTTVSKNDNEVGEDFVNNNQQDDSEKNVVVEEIETPVVKELAEVEVVEEEPELLFMSDIFEEETLLGDNSSTDLDLSITADLDLLDQAKKAYSEKDYTNALSFVNKFLETSNSSIDEALYLKGQILEKPFEQRNIRDALECYKLVISAYPQSDLWDKCDERIKYIQRFYFNIR